MTTAHPAIDRALAMGDVSTAARLAVAAVAAGSATPMILHLAAWAHETDSDFAAARALLAQAAALAPRDAAIVTARGRIERRTGDLAAGLRLFDAAIALNPGFADPWLERGFALDAGGSLAAAAASYARAGVLDPGCAPAFAGAASVAARTGDRTARALAERALALSPGDTVAALALATVDLEDGDARAAAARVRALAARPDVTPNDRAAALTLLGDALDKQGESADAFAAWHAAQAGVRARFAPAFAGREDHRAFVERIAAAIDRIAAAPPPAIGPVASEAAGHVFLLGYPRSGTTLTENILASSPAVTALEERPTLAAADAEFLTDPGGLDRLARLDAATAARLRMAYWAKVAASGGSAAGTVGGTTFVDMDPLKGIKLPVIARLFPDATIVVMRRDPRDTVLSAFRTNFSIGAATFEFTDLVATARHYDAVMRLTEAALAVFPIRAHVVRYDALVADFDATVAALCAATGIPWSPAMREFGATARRRGVATASAAQVRRDLYDGGGAWRRHAAALAPVLPILAPWVERFGFAP
jgi:tetratricopeptide (TPR) repeat protein